MTPADKRRQYGTGSVHRRHSDGRWIGTIEAGYTTTGARRRITVSGKTKADAKRKLRDRRLQLDRDGLPTAGASHRDNLKLIADRYLDDAVTHLRPNTYIDYAGTVRKWIVPTLGHRRLNELTPGDLRALDKAQRAAGLTSTTLRHTRAVLSQVLKFALAEGHNVPSSVLVAKRPRVGTNDRQALTTAEAAAIIETALRLLPHGSRWVAAFLQGIRQAECLGLTWDAVNLTGGTIDISWQLKAIPYLDRRAGTFRIPDGYELRHLELAWHLVRPKTAKGHRVIPLVPWMRAALEAWRDVAPDSPHRLVWPTVDGRPADSKQDLDEFKALQATAGVGHPAGRYYLTHEARHTTATLLLEAGVDPEVIKAILGHSSIVTSRGYMHVSQALATQAMERVAEQLQLPSS